jgi:uncharacterized damage-inducible protein DinB
MPWIERRFTFDLPVSMFPNVLERLRGTPARIDERLRGVPEETLRRQAGENWSIQENVGHLIKVEGLWIGRLQDFAAGLDTLRPADMSNRSTHEAGFNEVAFEEIASLFRQVRGEFVEQLEQFTDAEIARSAKHPRLDQPMRVLDLMIFAAEHDDHHLARITELLRNADNPGA